MVNKYKFKNLEWIDLESPTNEEIKEVLALYKVNPLIGEELRNPSHKPKIELYKDTIFSILHFPAFKHTHNDKEINQEVDFILGKKYLITVRYDSIDALHKFSKEFEVNTILEKSEIGDHAGFLFYLLLKKLYKSVSHELDFIEALLSEIEGRIFEGEEKLMVREISEVSRVLLDFRQTIGNHKDVMNSLIIAGTDIFGKDFSYYLKSLSFEHDKVSSIIDNLRESMFELRQTNNSLLSTKQNEAMKVLSIMAFVTFPLMLVSSIFGMNTDYLPIVGHQYDFAIVASIMVLLTVVFFAYFKYKKWL